MYLNSFSKKKKKNYVPKFDNRVSESITSETPLSIQNWKSELHSRKFTQDEAI